jgi:hypothetical protein
MTDAVHLQEGAEPVVMYGARETIRACRPIVAFEQAANKLVSPDMIAALDLPDEVSSFDFVRWCVDELSYKLVTPPDQDRRNYVLVPLEAVDTLNLDVTSGPPDRP